MNVRKIIRILGISLALVALLVFATDFVSDWHNDNSTNDGQCPYCHVSYQAPAQPEATQCVVLLSPVGFLPPRKMPFRPQVLSFRKLPRAHPAA